MNRTDAIVLILRQLKEGLTIHEEQTLNTWLAEDPEHVVLRKHITMLQGAAWHLVPQSPAPDFLAQQLDTLHHRAAELEARKQHKQMSIRMAAVITLAILASQFIYLTIPDDGNTLSFSQTELNQVAQTLERVYHISLEVDTNTVGELRFTGMFVNADVNDVLTALRASLPVVIVQHHDSYELKAR